MTKIRVIIFVFTALAIVTTIGLGYRHYQTKLVEIEILTTNNAKLELSVQTQQGTITDAEQTIREWQVALRAVEERNRQLEEIANEAREEQQRLEQLFSELDIAGSAVKDPVALSVDIDRRFDYLNCMFEQASGTGNLDCVGRLADPAAAADLP